MDREKMIEMSKLIESLKTSEIKLLSSYEEGYIGKRVYQVTLNDGSSRSIEQITKNKDNGDAVVIIPITVDGNYIMVIESRPNTKETVAVEFPAGMIDEGEEAIIAAKRELLEETGYEVGDIQELEWHYQDQGCSQAIIRTYIATDCKKVSDINLDGNERLKPMEMSYNDIVGLIKSNKYINDANTKIAFMNYTLKKKGLL